MKHIVKVFALTVVMASLGFSARAGITHIDHNTPILSKTAPTKDTDGNKLGKKEARKQKRVEKISKKIEKKVAKIE